MGITLITLTSCQSAPVEKVTDPALPAFYTTQVRPIFGRNCIRCHGGFSHKGGLSMDTRESMLKGGEFGPALIPGDPQHSLLLKLIRHAGPQGKPGPMPPEKPKLSGDDILTVERWIRAGAIMP